MVVVGRRDWGDVAGEMDADVDCVVVDVVVVVVVFMVVCMRWGVDKLGLLFIYHFL